MGAGPPSRREVLDLAAGRLRAAGVESFRRDAEELLAHCLGLSRSILLAELARPLARAEAFEGLLARRLRREPLQQILGEWEFRTLNLAMRPGVFIPRPETELLVERALAGLAAHFSRGALRGLEMGVGSGAISLALLRENGRLAMRASDISEAALALAGENARRLGLDGRLALERRAGLPSGEETVHLVVSNPPYVALTEKDALPPEVAEHDPPEALFAGEDGLDAYRELAATAPARLLAGGILAVEIGEGQAEAVARLFAGAGLVELRVHRDYAGRDRFVMARRAHT